MRFLFLLSLSLILSTSYGSLVQVNGKWVSDKYAPSRPIAEHYDYGLQKMSQGDWDAALKNFMVIITHFSNAPLYADALYQSGVCYLEKRDYDMANRLFSKYLELGSGNLKYFEKVFEYKFTIAEKFASGKKKHLFGMKGTPKWMPAKSVALDLYDEVIASLPSHDIAAKSLYGKAKLLLQRRDFRESIESLQTLTRRFPKHTLSADAFLLIGEVYLAESRMEAQNPDLLSLAKLNLDRFRKRFPGDERYTQAEGDLAAMQEIFAQSLYETARYYDRKKKYRACSIYYGEAIRRYPDTEYAKKSEKRLELIAKK